MNTLILCSENCSGIFYQDVSVKIVFKKKKKQLLSTANTLYQTMILNMVDCFDRETNQQ